MIYCDHRNPRGGLQCEGLRGHTGPHAAMDWKAGYMKTWPNKEGKKK